MQVTQDLPSIMSKHFDVRVAIISVFFCVFLVCGLRIPSECVDVFCQFWIIIPKTRIQDSEKVIEVFYHNGFFSLFFIAFFLFLAPIAAEFNFPFQELSDLNTHE